MSLELQVYVLEVVVAALVAGGIFLAIQTKDHSKKIKRMRGR